MAPGDLPKGIIDRFEEVVIDESINILSKTSVGCMTCGGFKRVNGMGGSMHRMGISAEEGVDVGP